LIFQPFQRIARPRPFGAGPQETRIIGERPCGVKRVFLEDMQKRGCSGHVFLLRRSVRGRHRCGMADTSDSTPPDAGSLHQAALAYLARYAATEAGLRRVLDRRIDRWARSVVDRDSVAEHVAAAKQAARIVVARLAAAGAVSDAVFAESRARSLVSAGRSRRAVAARLAAKGVDAELAQAVLPQDADTELAAAFVLTRKRRIGPFRTAEDADRQREFGILARAGFPRPVAERALDADPEEAEEAIRRLRQG
jgi:regulatory protein